MTQAQNMLDTIEDLRADNDRLQRIADAATERAKDAEAKLAAHCAEDDARAERLTEERDQAMRDAVDFHDEVAGLVGLESPCGGQIVARIATYRKATK
jgi:predicted  nucleic acid-binding Zn-ribbon protein